MNTALMANGALVHMHAGHKATPSRQTARLLAICAVAACMPLQSACVPACKLTGLQPYSPALVDQAGADRQLAPPGLITQLLASDGRC